MGKSNSLHMSWNQNWISLQFSLQFSIQLFHFGIGPQPFLRWLVLKRDAPSLLFVETGRGRGNLNLHVASPLNSLLYIFDLITEILISWLRGDNGKGVGEWARRLPTPFTTSSGSEKRECRGCLGNGSMFVVRRSQRRCRIRRCVCL